MENKFMRVEEVAEVLEVSTSFAYKVIRQLTMARRSAKTAPYQKEFTRFVPRGTA